MKYRSQSLAPEDEKVELSEVSAQPWFRALTSNIAPMQKVPEPCLVGAGCSRIWDDMKSVPVVVENNKVSATGNFYTFTLDTRKPEWKLKARVLGKGEKNIFDVFAANFFFPKQDPAGMYAGGSSSAAGTNVNLIAKPLTSMDERGHVTVVLSSDESQGSSGDNIPSSPPSAGGEEGDKAVALAIESFGKRKIPLAGGEADAPSGRIRVTVRPPPVQPVTTSAEPPKRTAAAAGLQSPKGSKKSKPSLADVVTTMSQSFRGTTRMF